MKKTVKISGKKAALASAVAMVAVAATTLVTASYAWFTNSGTATVDEMTVKVSTADSLLISTAADGEFKTSITEEELWNVSTNFVSKVKGSGGDAAFSTATSRELAPATPKTVATSKIALTGSALDFQTLKDGKQLTKDITTNTTPSDDNHEDNWYITAPTVAATTVSVNYLKFDLYLQASMSSENLNIVLDLTSDDAGTYSGTTIRPTETTGDKMYITNALRMAFITSDVTTSPTPVIQDSLKVLEVNSATPANLREGFIDTAKAYTPDLALSDTAVTNATGNVIPTSNLVLTSSSETKTNTVYKVTVYMWIEGNDKQAVNEVSASSFVSNLKFSLVSGS